MEKRNEPEVRGRLPSEVAERLRRCSRRSKSSTSIRLNFHRNFRRTKVNCDRHPLFGWTDPLIASTFPS